MQFGTLIMNLKEIWEKLWPPKPYVAPGYPNYPRPEMTLEKECQACEAMAAYAKAQPSIQAVDYTCAVCFHTWQESMKTGQE